MKIRALMFDLGNVVIFFDDERKIRQLAEVTGMAPREIRNILHAEGWQRRFECGELSTEEFFAPFHERAGGSASALARAFSDIFTLNTSLTERLPQLREAGLRLVIVSNTNAEHMRWEQEQHDFFQHFDAAIYSHEVGALKPSQPFYAAAAEAAQCAPKEALWIDDLENNCQGAFDFGFQVHHFQHTDGLLKELALLGILPDKPS